MLRLTSMFCLLASLVVCAEFASLTGNSVYGALGRCSNTEIGSWRGADVEYVSDQIIVRRAHRTEPADLAPLLFLHDAIVLESLYGWSLVAVPETEDVLDMIDVLVGSPLIRWAEPNLIMSWSGVVPPDSLLPNDKKFYLQWGLNNTGELGGTVDADIDAPEAWTIAQAGDSIKVAVVDQGIAMFEDDSLLCHPDLDSNSYIGSNRILAGAYFANNDTLFDKYRLRACTGHGTAVAGIIGATTSLSDSVDSAGVAGVDGKSRVMVCKAGVSLEPPYLWDQAHAIAWSSGQPGIRAVNYSGGQPGVCCSILVWAVAHADTQGVLVACAKGNTSTGINCPAHHANEYESVIAVGATNWYDKMVWGNDSTLTVMAPGGRGQAGTSSTDSSWILSTDEGCCSGRDYYRFFSGTSFATPFVTGVASLLFSYDPSITHGEAKEMICRSVDKVHPGIYSYTKTGPYGRRCDKMGYGRVNAYKALYRLKGYGNIITDVTWHNDIDIKGDIFVPSGVTLTVDPGVTVKFAASSDAASGGVDTTLCELIVEGTLIANGTDSNRIRFVSSSSTTPGQWYGIRFVDTTCSACSLTHCEISGARTGVTVGSGIQVVLNSDSIMYSHYGIKTINTPSSMNIQNNAIFATDSVGILCTGQDCSVKIRDNRIYYNQLGIACMDKASPNCGDDTTDPGGNVIGECDEYLFYRDSTISCSTAIKAEYNTWITPGLISACVDTSPSVPPDTLKFIRADVNSDLLM